LDSISKFNLQDFSQKTFFKFFPANQEFLVQKNGLLSLHSLVSPPLKNDNTAIEFKGTISAAFLDFDNRFVIFGDKLGYLHLGDFKSGKIKNSLKIHDSGISSIVFLKIQNQDILVTSGFDHKINIIPFEKSTFAFLNPVTLIGHSGWVTDLHYDYSKEILISGGNDQLIRYWIINPDKIK
jgi:WD40 repeat protein